MTQLSEPGPTPMVRWRAGRVGAVVRRWRGAVELRVELERRDDSDPEQVRALAHPALVGEPEPGDRVLLNTGALAMGLGTGGYALVIALPDRLPPDALPAAHADRSAGHLVKARYTPLQAIVLGADEEASPYRQMLADADDLAGMPVVTADLHSALPAILAGALAQVPGARVAYLMTDGGALPAWFSRTLDALAGTLAGTVTVGQAFGGDLEATNVHSGLLAARYALGADLAIVAQGPGNLGTGTRWGFSGVAVGEAVNAVAALGGRPVGSLRISAADPRPRHRGVSHHSLTAYGRVALAPADLVVPEGLDAELAATIDAALEPLAMKPAEWLQPAPSAMTPAERPQPAPSAMKPAEWPQPAPSAAPSAGRHRIVRVSVDGLDEALRALPVKLSTMGRDLDTDHVYFLAAAAAGRHAATLIE